MTGKNPTDQLPPDIERKEINPFEQLEHLVNCADSIASSLRAIAIVQATLHRETLEEKDAKIVIELLDLE